METAALQSSRMQIKWTVAQERRLPSVAQVIAAQHDEAVTPRHLGAASTCRTTSAITTFGSLSGGAKTEGKFVRGDFCSSYAMASTVTNRRLWRGLNRPFKAWISYRYLYPGRWPGLPLVLPLRGEPTLSPQAWAAVSAAPSGRTVSGVFA